MRARTQKSLKAPFTWLFLWSPGFSHAKAAKRLRGQGVRTRRLANSLQRFVPVCQLCVNCPVAHIGRCHSCPSCFSNGQLCKISLKLHQISPLRPMPYCAFAHTTLPSMVSILWVCAFISPTCLPTSAFRPSTDTETAATDAKSGSSEIHGASLRASEVVRVSAGGGASLIPSLAEIAKPEVSAGDGSAEAGAPADECEKQLKILEEHVFDFCRKVQPELKNGTFKWLTYITDVDYADMASKIMHALRWGKRDASHGLLFTKQAFHDKNSTLLLLSGVSPESREKWRKALNTYMLRAGSNDDFQTPFGCLIEQTKENDELLGGCEWPQQEPIWQTASDAVVWRNGDDLVRFLVNKPLVKENWTLQQTIFYRAELPTLARYPPAEGFRVLNLHPHVRCIHLMPIIRHKIEQNGLLDDWGKVKTFSCVDTAGERMQEDLKALDSKASEFLKPGGQIKPECAISPLTEEAYKKCRGEGHVDFQFIQRMAMQFPMNYRPDIPSLRLPSLVGDNPQLLRVLPDLMEMFDTTISAELCLTQFVNSSSIAELDAGLRHQACQEAHAALQKLPQRALKHPERSVRRVAAQALGAMGKEAMGAVPALQNALEDSDATYSVREAAAEALGAMGKEAVGAVPALQNVLKDSDVKDSVREAAAQALQAMGKEAVPALQNVLKDSDVEDSVREAAAHALGAMGKEAVGAVPALQNALKDSDVRDWVREAAAQALGAMGKEAVPALQNVLEDSDVKDWVRKAAAQALGAMGKEAVGAVPALQNVLKDSDVEDSVREAAAQAQGPWAKRQWEQCLRCRMPSNTPMLHILFAKLPLRP